MDRRIPDKALYSVAEAAAVLSLSRTVLYELIRSRRLRSVKEGRCRRLSSTAIFEYIDLLERESSEAA